MLLHASVLFSDGLFPGTRLRGCMFQGPAEAGGWGMGFSYFKGKKAWGGGEVGAVYGIVYDRYKAGGWNGVNCFGSALSTL